MAGSLRAAGIFGLGIGLAFAAMANLIVRSVPAEQTGAATGMNANIRTIGGSIGASVTSVLVTSRLQPSGLPYASGYTHSFGLLAVFCLGAAGAALLVPTRTARRKRTDQTAVATSTSHVATRLEGGDEREPSTAEV
ncbi:MFS family permease [Streptacidiphilus sp. MAP12-20]